MVNLASVIVQLSTVNSEKSPDQSPFCTVQEGVGVNVGVGVNGTVGVGVSVDTGVFVAVGGIGVFVGVDVNVGPSACPGPQADIDRLIDSKITSKLLTDLTRCFVFIFLLAL